MFLTIFCVVPSRMGDDYLSLYREALLRWNARGLEDTQVIILPQREIGIDISPFELYPFEFERVTGYPVWDLMKHVRAAWPRVKGQYVTFDHPEFIWGPDRLDRTIAYLQAYKPIYAMGNLRRPGAVDEATASDFRDDQSRAAAEWFRAFLRGAWDSADKAFEYLQTTTWMYWSGAQQKPGPAPWVEDVFYCPKNWLDAWGFCNYGLELPFQDVYDLMQYAVRTHYQFGLPFQCLRMPQSINRLMHLWHPRYFSSWSPEMRDWFFAQPERWKDTRFLDKELWDRLIAFNHLPQKEKNTKPISELRFGPRGTSVRYGVAISQWLQDGGVEVMREFYAQRAEDALR